MSLLTNYLKTHWVIVLILILATLIRVWNIQTHAIFFGDAAHDMTVAAQAVENREIPLLGIASSVPRFKQGPVTIWMHMALYTLFGYQVFPYSMFFIILSLVAIILMYEWAYSRLSPQAAVVAVILLSFSPLAIAQARMPYHITPLPLFLMLYLYSLSRLWQKQRWGAFGAVLGWCGIFQFELAVLPLLLLIPFTFWRAHLKITKTILIQVGAGFGVGLLPQIIYDLTHRFAQLGGFAAWVVYRMVSAFGVTTQHAFSFSKISTTIFYFKLYWQRFFSYDQPYIFMFSLFLIGWALYCVYSAHRKTKLKNKVKANFYEELVTAGFLLLVVGYFIHGSPSEAYFPPFFIFLPLLIGIGLSKLRPVMYSAALGIVCLIAIVNVQAITKHNFFVSTSHSFSYGPSISEQQAIIDYILHQESQFYLRTTTDGGTFANYFDNLRWHALAAGVTETPDEGNIFYIEPKNSPLQSYPLMTKVPFTTLDVYQVY